MKPGFLFVFVLLMASSSFGQQYWKKANEESLNLRSLNGREIIPNKYETFSLEMSAITQILNKAPKENNDALNKNGISIFLPLPNGKLEEFIVWQSLVMEEELANKYPSIKTYKGYQKTNPSVTTRFSTGIIGFHAAVRDGDNMIYIDPYSTENYDYYNVYYTSDHVDESLKNNICGTDEATISHANGPKWGTRSFKNGKMEMRKYRLALACTGEWGERRGTKEAALAEMATFIERANIVFEAELALRLVIINNNDLLIFLDGDNDPYTNSNMGLEIVNQNSNVINQAIGFDKYDIGHVFSICNDVGGVASGNICTPRKGAGVTCYNGTSISNGNISTFNHEVAHQMTAQHTFNACDLPPDFQNQLAIGNGYEPGSGSTIMSYANSCGAKNLGVPRDNYYHVATLQQILNYTNTEGSEAYTCAEKIDINNFVPVIDMPYQDGFFIPKSTPFFLKATATDENGDNMTYNWEQFDAQGSSPLGEPVGNAPIFRSLRPTANSARYFPNVSRILNRDFTNVQEFMPTYGRDLTFRFVVRDNNPLGSAAVWEEIKFKVAPGDVGPFELTYPVNEVKMEVGKKLNVTWNVANTDKAPVNCKFVDIYVSLNNNLDFNSEMMVKVAENVPNDGSETIIVPNTPSTTARIVIKASDNIFFTTGLRNSRIDLPTSPSFFVDVKEPGRKVCLPDEVAFEFSSIGLAGLAENINFEVISGLPQGATAAFSKNDVAPGDSTMLDIDLSNVVGTANYEVIVRSYVTGIDTIDRILRLNLTGTDLDNHTLLTPTNGLNGVGPTQKYNWAPIQDATLYEHQVATSPSFTTDKLVLSSTTPDTFFISNTFLEKSTIYFWRVRSSNECKIGEWSEINAFNTESLDCTLLKSGSLSINISQSGLPKIQTDLYIDTDGSISDVNVKNIRASHQWASDLVAFLVAPSGKESLLWSRKCSTSNGVNVGLDDQSNEFFQCPIGTGKIYRPESPLSTFNGENMKGNWSLRLEDRAAGNGGRLLNFDLELCANIVLNPPFLVNNEVLKVQPKETKEINTDLLLANDPDNSASELVYTLINEPSMGILSLNGSPINVGNKFSQEDINQAKIQYLHTGENEGQDSFKFIVADGKGGWVSITEFVILVEKTSSTTVPLFKERIMVYPNPAEQLVHVKSIDNGVSIKKCVLTDITGRIILQKESPESDFTLDISHILTGVYTVSIHTDNQIITKKLVKK